MIATQLMQNKILIVTVIAWTVSCLIKGVIYFIVKRKLAMKNIFGTGGMPSSHSATTAALATIIGFERGFDNDLFAISFAFALIVMYDAMGIRRAAGVHAKHINYIEEKLLEKESNELKLNESLGHRPIEVLAGALIGIVIATLAK